MMYGKKLDSFIKECKEMGVEVKMFNFEYFEPTDEDVVREVEKLDDSSWVLLKYNKKVFTVASVYGRNDKKEVILKENGKLIKSLKTQQAMIDYMLENFTK